MPLSLKKHFDFSNYHQASKPTNKFNGKIYNNKIKYVVVYRIGYDGFTELISDTGFISVDWNYQYNKAGQVRFADWAR